MALNIGIECLNDNENKSIANEIVYDLLSGIKANKARVLTLLDTLQTIYNTYNVVKNSTSEAAKDISNELLGTTDINKIRQLMSTHSDSCIAKLTAAVMDLKYSHEIHNYNSRHIKRELDNLYRNVNKIHYPIKLTLLNIFDISNIYNMNFNNITDNDNIEMSITLKQKVYDAQRPEDVVFENSTKLVSYLDKLKSTRELITNIGNQVNELTKDISNIGSNNQTDDISVINNILKYRNFLDSVVNIDTYLQFAYRRNLKSLSLVCK